MKEHLRVIGLDEIAIVNSTSYEEIKSKIENINDKIIAVVITKNDCDACKHFIETSLSKIEDEKLEIYSLDIEKVEALFPLPTTPITYFFIKGCEVYPIIRQGVAELDNLKNEVKQFKRILNGEKFNEVF